MSTLYDYTLERIVTGDKWDLSELEGKVVLFVNVASKCGFTEQYAGLEKLYQTYKDRGLVVIGAPCNQFMKQEPKKEDAIQAFCKRNYNVSFPLTSKIEVNGPGADPVYNWLKEASPGDWKGLLVKWNFEKFLVDRQGKVYQRYLSPTTPEDIIPDIEKLL